MSRRVYSQQEKRNQTIKKAMHTLRLTREKIDPDVLRRARDAVIEASGGLLGQKPEDAKRDRLLAAEGKVAIDRRKNMSTVIAFLKDNPDNKAVMRELQTLLSEDI